jgi:lipoprotein-anchoring transpeptidase ErfK/SrfK
MGYWLTKADGVADASTRHAITAFQKVEGLKRTGTLNAATMAALRKADRPAPNYTGEAHIEIDLTRQVLFVVDGNGAVTHILPVSSGNEEKYFDEGKWQIAHTPRGAFNIERKINGVRKASLGDLYYPSYFSGGVAIHGSNSIPVKPASHGCVRIPRFADKAFFQMAPLGMLVFVYD